MAQATIVLPMIKAILACTIEPTVECISLQSLFVSPVTMMCWCKEACRNLEKGEQAVADIVRASNSSSVRSEIYLLN